MDIERLRQAVIDKRFILNANPDWRAGRACGLSDDETEQKANDALAIILENIAELVVAYLIDARQSVKSEDVAEAIDLLMELQHDNYVFQNHTEQDVKNYGLISLAITALQAYQPWIPVSNVKPEKSGRYIAYVPEHWTADSHKEGKVIIAYFRELNYEGKRRVWDDGAYSISGEVTHYLPLPEPQKGE